VGDVTFRADRLQGRWADRFEDLRGRVLVYAGDNGLARSFAPHCDGLVLHGAAGRRAARALSAQGSVLHDPERYADDVGKPKVLQLAQLGLFDESPQETIQAQMAVGVCCLLAPSRFPLERDEHSMRALLEAGEEFVEAADEIAPGLPVLVPIVVRFDELADRRWVRPVSESGLPIAPVFAGRGDPVGTHDRLEGALELLDCAELAVPLRCDLSLAGFIALGAVCGALGSSSTVRHLWLPTGSGGQGPPHVFVPTTASWMKAEFVEQAMADPHLDALFHCDCAVCGPDGDVRPLAATRAPPELLARHSVASSVAVVRQVVGAEHPLDAWHTLCEGADRAYTVLAEAGIAGPTRPGALGAWLQQLR
jgi:hypothetical protein